MTTIKEPAKRIRIAGSENRIWTEAEVEAVKRYKATNFYKRS
jgi:hypothetical protein